MSRTGWHLRANAPVFGWLVAVLLVTVVHPFVPQPRWLMVHLLLLGAVSNAILVWSAHFTDALLHSAPSVAARRRQAQRLLLLNVGVLLVVAGVVSGRWAVTAAGAVGVAVAVGWHGWSLVRQARVALPSRFGATVRYYVAAAAFLPVGAVLGSLLARGLGDPLHGRVMLAHAAVNLLGWVGLTVAGTLVTLWPTMLRTRIAPGAERAARQALPVLVAGVVVVAGSAVLGLRFGTALGVLVYLTGLAVAARPLAYAARGRAPSSYPTWSVLAGLGWLTGSLVALAGLLVTAPTAADASARLGLLTAPLTVGFAAQVLLGALSYLVPVVLGGGPAATRAATAVLDRGGALRITVANLGLVVCVLPVPSLVRVIVSLLVLAVLAAFLPLLVIAVRASRRGSERSERDRSARGRGGHDRPDETRPARRTPAGMVAVGLGAVLIAVAGGAALDPGALAGTTAESASDGVRPTGDTTTVTVEARDMRFTPARIDVPAGDRLVIVVDNTDNEDVHDLVLESGHRSGRLAPGESATVEVGVVGRDLDGWCSVVGHRQMGMTLTVNAVGHTPDRDPAGAHAHHGAPAGADAADGLDLMAEPGHDFTEHDPTLPARRDTTVHRVTLRVRDVVREVAPGVRQRLWTYNGTMPGPTLRGTVGDVFEITLVNDGSVGHSIDFHAGALAPDRPMRTISPGESLVYRFTARSSGAWLYHCASMPMSTHMANGLFGAVIIEPPDLRDVDREYLLVQSEVYLGAPGGEVDPAKIAAERPDIVAFNGYANQYQHRPLTARVGERVRVWVVAAGPNRGTAFHVVGGIFDTAFAEGRYLLRPGRAAAGGSQVLDLAPGQGGFVELEFPEPGRYPFLSHSMVDAERGASGAFEVRAR